MSERITVADITAELAVIEASRRDPEGAHKMEDLVWIAVLEAIRDGAPGAPALAAEALKSLGIQFDRWSA